MQLGEWPDEEIAVATAQYPPAPPPSVWWAPPPPSFATAAPSPQLIGAHLPPPASHEIRIELPALHHAPVAAISPTYAAFSVPPPPYSQPPPPPLCPRCAHNVVESLPPPQRADATTQTSLNDALAAAAAAATAINGTQSLVDDIARFAPTITADSVSLDLIKHVVTSLRDSAPTFRESATSSRCPVLNRCCVTPEEMLKRKRQQVRAHSSICISSTSRFRFRTAKRPLAIVDGKRRRKRPQKRNSIIWTSKRLSKKMECCALSSQRCKRICAKCGCFLSKTIIKTVQTRRRFSHNLLRRDLD